jgi:predicted RNA-binding Zn ribbon-like protein
LVVSRPIEEISVDRESELLVAFLNTRDFEDPVDLIGTAEELERWIRDSGAGVGAPRVDAAGHARVLALRESLRVLLRVNNGGEASESELAPLREAATQAGRLQASVATDGAVRIEPAGGGVEAFEARLLLAIARLQELGAWPRLKACPAGDCQWAFFDTSRNRSRTWCSMEVCGNRSKTRRYRSRRSG